MNSQITTLRKKKTGMKNIIFNIAVITIAIICILFFSVYNNYPTGIVDPIQDPKPKPEVAKILVIYDNDQVKVITKENIAEAEVKHIVSDYIDHYIETLGNNIENNLRKHIKESE